MERNLIETEFLDITFTFVIKKYFPFRKAANKPLFINDLLSINQPPTIMKQLPKIISKIISDLSCNKEEFNKVKSVYETALRDREHFSSMSFNNSNTQNTRRSRNSKVLWFNPP